MYQDDTRNLIAFDSITEAAAWGNKNCRKSCDNRSGENQKFYGSTTWEQLMAGCAVGDDSSIPAAQKLMAKLESSIVVPVNVYESSVAGYFPNIPEFLSGEPECMWDVAQRESDTAPLSIYMDMTTSAGIKPEQYYKRGIAVLALAMLLSSVRPISLHVCTIMDGYDKRTKEMIERNENYSMVTARVETAPLDLTRAALMMTNVAVARRLFYSIAKGHLGFCGSWPRFNTSDFAASTSEPYIARVRELLGIDGEVLYIPAVSMYEGQFEEMVERPVEWLNKMLKQYGGIEQ